MYTIMSNLWFAFWTYGLFIKNMDYVIMGMIGFFGSKILAKLDSMDSL